ncbi:hypothetical protein AtubIFM57143_000542 [Aspergillus tubingensis]|nr:hypothetical protein AtubIFM57143_000542 [Aspergillus tubingensis]
MNKYVHSLFMTSKSSSLQCITEMTPVPLNISFVSKKERHYLYIAAACSSLKGIFQLMIFFVWICTLLKQTFSDFKIVDDDSCAKRKAVSSSKLDISSSIKN